MIGTMQEEKNTDAALTKVAESVVNQEASSIRRKGDTKAWMLPTSGA